MSKQASVLVSVIIPTYKRSEELVVRAVTSVLNQTYSNLEVLVIDDNGDNKQISERLDEALKNLQDERVKYINPLKNQGACAARNLGIEKAEGEYITFLDDDDEYKPTKVEKQVFKLLKNKDAAMVYCGIEYKNDITGKITKIRSKYMRGDIYKQQLKSNLFGTCVLMTKKKCLLRCGGFNVDMPSSQDYELIIRLSKLYKVDYVKEILVIAHEHGGKRISENLGSRVGGYEKIMEIYKTEIEKDKGIYSYQTYNLAKFYILAGQKEKGVQYLKKAIRLRPLSALYYCGVILFWVIKKRYS